jgi:cell division protein FtsL
LRIGADRCKARAGTRNDGIITRVEKRAADLIADIVLVVVIVILSVVYQSYKDQGQG